MTVDAQAVTVREAALLSLGRTDGEVQEWSWEESDHLVENMTTSCLGHVRGRLTDGTPFHLFRKVLHPASCSPVWPLIPPAFHDQVLKELHWLDEVSVYESSLSRDLPAPVSMPRVWHVDAPEPQRRGLWMEPVPDAARWDLPCYIASARALGALSGRWPESRVSRELGRSPRSLQGLFHGRITQAVLPALADPAVWEHPALAQQGDLRAALAHLASRGPELLARAEALPQALAHGDAAPANMLWPDDTRLVLIDWSYAGSSPYGSDLAQLVAGRAVAGIDENLAVLVEAVVPAYVEGLASEGVRVGTAEVQLALAAHLLVRSGFSAVLLERPDLDADALLPARVRLARTAVELAQQQL